MLRKPIDDPGRYYDDAQTIVLRSGQTLEEERRVLWHELVHAERRDRAGHNDAAVERLVDRHAAENAMPWSAIEWAWERATDLTEMAGLLKLPEAWVHRRLMNLHPARKASLRLNHQVRHDVA